MRRKEKVKLIVQNASGTQALTLRGEKKKRKERKIPAKYIVFVDNHFAPKKNGPKLSFYSVVLIKGQHIS